MDADEIYLNLTEDLCDAHTLYLFLERNPKNVT